MPGPQRGKPRASYEALPPVRRKKRRVKDFSRQERIVWGVTIGTIVAAWLAWFIWAYPVRSELRRVERYLDTRPRTTDVHLAIPWFSHTMPETVPLTATGLPGGYSYEVHVELSGEYDTRTRTAHIKGWKQVLLPYEKAVMDDTYQVPGP